MPGVIDEPVVAELVAVGQGHALGPGIDRARHGAGERDACLGDVVVLELLLLDVAQTGQHPIAERSRR